MITEETIARMKQNLEVKNEFFVLDVVKQLEKENEDLKNKNFVATQLYNNALTENKGLKDIITELRKENKQLQTRFHIVPEHYLTEALNKCHELERKNAEQNEIIHELHKPQLYDGYSLQLEDELKAQIKSILVAKLKSYETLWNEQQKAIKEKSAQIEKMKCCHNCKKFIDKSYCITPCEEHSKWELADE